MLLCKEHAPEHGAFQERNCEEYPLVVSRYYSWHLIRLDMCNSLTTVMFSLRRILGCHLLQYDVDLDAVPSINNALFVAAVASTLGAYSSH